MTQAGAAASAVLVEPSNVRHSVLIIDDEPQQCALMRRALSDRYDCEVAVSAEDARALMKAAKFDLILCDVELAGESGIDLLQELPTLQPDAGVIMVTATDDVRTAEAALSYGAYGYMVKPFRTIELVINVFNALRRRSLEMTHRAYTGRLEARLLERTSALNAAFDELESARLETLHRLSLAVEARDRITADHIEGMIKIVERFARKLGYDEADAQRLGAASAMHDVGKIGVPDEILLKPGPLTLEERQTMEQHTEIGYRMLSGSENPLLKLSAEIALTHHERWDGTGYPRGLKGDQIPISARIVQIIDVYSAITTDRPYRDALPLEHALRELAENAGTQFDPRLVKVFIDSFDEIVL